MQLPQAQEILYQAFSVWAGPPPAEHWQALKARLRLQRITKGQWVNQAGDRPTELQFVCAGLLRMYYLRPDGREFNKSFLADPSFAADMVSLLEGSPSRMYIQCLEDSYLLSWNYQNLTELYQADAYFQKLGRLMAEHLYVKKIKREAALLMDSAGQRYEDFLQEYGSLENRLPDYHIASYLGITPEALSRLKKALLSAQN